MGSVQQPDQDPSLSTGSRDIGQQPGQDPSQSTGSMETGQQPEDLIWNHPFTLEGEPRTPENWPEIYSQYLEDSPIFPPLWDYPSSVSSTK